MREQIGRGFAMVPPSVACDRRVSCEQTARSLTVGHENPSSQQLAQHILQNQGLLEAGEFCLQHEFGERRVRIQHHRRRLNTAAQPWQFNPTLTLPSTENVQVRLSGSKKLLESSNVYSSPKFFRDCYEFIKQLVVITNRKRQRSHDWQVSGTR